MDEETQNRRRMMDAVYGAPSLAEQSYFRVPGKEGPMTEGMQAQKDSETGQGAFDPHEEATVESINANGATISVGGKTMKVPANILPKGATTGMCFDVRTGKVIPHDNDANKAVADVDDMGG